MSFLHVLSDVGKTALKYGGPLVASVVPGPLGTLITAAISVATAEVEHGSASGPAKLEQATQSTIPAAVDSPLPADARVVHLQALISAIVAALNALGALFPSAAPAPATPK